MEEQIAYYQEKLESLAATHPEGQRLRTIPGIGPITATALLAAVGDVGVCKHGRQCAAWRSNWAALDPTIASRAKKGECVTCFDHFDLLQNGDKLSDLGYIGK